MPWVYKDQEIEGESGTQMTQVLTWEDEDPNAQPEVIAARKQTELIRNALRANQQASLQAKADAAEQTRAMMDSTMRLLSGDGLDQFGLSPGERKRKTLLGSIAANRSQSRSTGSNPLVRSAIEAQQQATSSIVQTQTLLERVVSGGSVGSGRPNRLQQEQ